MSFHLEQLVSSVESSAEWRAKKAEQYPDDERNRTASSSLTKLAERLRALPVDDQNVAAYDEVMNQAVELDDALVEIASHGSHYVGRYGFEYPQDGDPAPFLEVLTEEYREIVEAAGERLAEERREEEYEAAKEAADEAAKEVAEGKAKEAAEEAAKQAAQQAYEETYREVYEDAYKKALIEVVGG